MGINDALRTDEDVTYWQQKSLALASKVDESQIVIARLRVLLRDADRYTGHDSECDAQLPNTEQCVCGYHALDARMCKEIYG